MRLTLTYLLYPYYLYKYPGHNTENIGTAVLAVTASSELI